MSLRGGWTVRSITGPAAEHSSPTPGPVNDQVKHPRHSTPFVTRAKELFGTALLHVWPPGESSEADAILAGNDEPEA